jgi:HK97 gp10 family phage protein
VKLKFEVTNTAQVSARLRALGKMPPGVVRTEILMAAARPIVAEAKRLVRVRSGAVKRNIYATPATDSGKGEEVFISVRKHAWRAKFLEFGFNHMGGKFVGPFPFLRPAFDTQKAGSLNIVKNLLGRAIDAAALRIFGGKK